MPKGNFFAGRFGRHPRVSAQVKDQALIPFSTGATRTVGVLGVAQGGEPGVPRDYSSPAEAATVLRGGELLDAVNKCFDPSTETRGAATVVAIPVNPATQGTLMLDDPGGQDVVLLTSRNWGLAENEIKVKIETGTNFGKRVTVAKGVDLYVRDNIGRSAFSIQYVGTGSGASMTITGVALTTSITGGPGTENLNIDLNTYNTVQKVVDRILSGSSAYAATVLDTNPNRIVLNGLDYVTAQDIRTSVYTVRADLQAFVDSLGEADPWQPFVTATRVAAADVPPANIPFTYLTGGTAGTTLTSHWQAAFDALQPKQVAFVVPVSGDAAIHAMADAHCHFMSSDGQLPRRAFVGGPLGEKTADLANYLLRSQNLNSDRTALAVQGIKSYDVNGVLTTYPPYITAAQLAGMASGLDEIGDSITFKALKASGLEWTPSLAELELGIAGSLLMIELAENRGFYRVTRGISTWRKDDAYHRVEISTGIALDEVIRRCIDGLEMFIGRKASPILTYAIASRTESILLSLAEQQIIVGEPAFRNISVTITGDTAAVQFEASPVIALNFVNITINATLFSGSVTVAVV
jgi:hypothetical protein